MQVRIWLTVCLNSLFFYSGTIAFAQSVDPAAGIKLEPKRYRTVLGKPPAIGSPAASDDLAILRWNQRTRTPESVVYTWVFLPFLNELTVLRTFSKMSSPGPAPL